MLYNYVKIALRNLLKNKFFSSISILGLAAGMSICLLIIVFLKQQMSYDGFHKKSDRIYHIYSEYKAPVNVEEQTYATSPYKLGSVLKDNIPGIEDYVTIRYFNGKARKGENSLDVKGYYTNPSILSMLDFELLQGNATTALDQPFTAVITEKTANKLFGNTNVVGNSITIPEQGEFLVTGVIKDIDDPTMFKFELLTSIKTVDGDKEYQERLNNWHRNVRSSFNFVLLKDGVDYKSIEAKLPSIIENHFPKTNDSWLEVLKMQNVTGITTGPVMGNPLSFYLPMPAIYILGGLSVIILFAACFNYVGLSIARALKRGKEVGIRKVIGAVKLQILYQFIVEAVITSTVSLFLASIFMKLLVNGFNNLTPVQFSNSQLNFNFTDIWLYVIFFGFSLFVGLLSGIYPAFYLSRFLPVKVLRGASRMESKGFSMRKVLIVSQFALSLIFIVSTFLLFQQSKHISKVDYGFNPNNIINVELGKVDYESFRNELLKNKDILEVSSLSYPVGKTTRGELWMKSEFMEEQEKGYTVWVDENYLDNLEIPIIAGRNFTKYVEGQVEDKVILNEVAVKSLKLGNPVDAIGKLITIEDSINVQVIGVVKDHIFFSALADIDPLVMRNTNRERNVANVKFLPVNYEQVKTYIKDTWKKFDKENIAEFGLYTNQLEEALELRLLKDFVGIIGLSASLAVLLACLGLLGITSFITETRLKEVGIRKTLGASTNGMIFLLSQSFIKLIIVAIVIATPLAYVINNMWLEQIGNRISIEPLLLIESILALLVIALINIASQTFKAANVNPIDILKQE